MKTKKIISLILAVCLAFCLCTGVVSVNAEGESNNKSENTQLAIRLENFNVSDGVYPVMDGFNTIVYSDGLDWSVVNIYVWNNETGARDKWPGVPMKFALVSEYEENQYVAYIPDEYDNFIINNGTEQTVDVEIYGSQGYWTDLKDTNGCYTLGNWSPEFFNISPETEDTETSTAATEDETTPTEPVDSYSLFFDNKNKWDEVYAYIWSGTGEGVVQNLGLWPGAACEDLGGDVYGIDAPAEFEYIIFHNGDGEETNILVNPGGVNYAVCVNAEDNTYMWLNPIPEPTTETTQSTEPEEKEPVKVYFRNVEDYGQVYAYVWGGENGEAFGVWPGSLCTDEGNGYWSAEIPADCTHVVFNNGNNGAQTNNLVNPGTIMVADIVTTGGTIYVYEWIEYVPETEPAETTIADDPTEAPAATEAPATQATDPAENSSAEVTEPAVVPSTAIVTEATETPSTQAPATEDESIPATDPAESSPATEGESTPVTEDESTVATGDETTAPSESTTAPAEPEAEQGDVNGDGKLNIKDVTAIQKFLAKLFEFTEEIHLLADFNGDGVVNIKDATTIQKKLANLI